MRVCTFCDRPAAPTEEHVIPKWLQRHFDLWNERMMLWNGTTLPYRQATVAACEYCNNERFSRLEQKIQDGAANRQDYYLWALKIRYGLALRDSTLVLDRRRPASGPLLPQEIATSGGTFIRHVFQYLDRRDFVVRPFPFGSVFLFDTGSAKPFDLVDVPPPYWALGIALPEGRILIVLFADRGVTRQVIRKYSWLGRELESRLYDHLPGMPIKALTFLLIRVQNHLIIPGGVRLNERGVFSVSIPKRIRLRPQRLEWYREIASHCGFDRSIADEAFERDAAEFGGGWVKL